MKNIEETKVISNEEAKSNVGLTVNDLLNYLTKEKKAGHGDYKIFVTDDEEANGYHALFFVGQTARQIEKENDTATLDYMEDSNHDLSLVKDDHYKAIYLG